jgi:hypothetical protein
LIIVVEVKYLLGTSDRDDDQKAGILDHTGSQLADQVKGLHHTQVIQDEKKAASQRAILKSFV